jgi:hypothetical protein
LVHHQIKGVDVIALHVSFDVEAEPIVKPDELMFPGTLPELAAIGILKNGTEKGEPVVIFRIDLPNGKVATAQTTLRLFQLAANAFAARYGWRENAFADKFLK